MRETLSDVTEAEAVETNRIEAFSDGVFAIAITLLVIELKLPETGDGSVWHGLVEAWPQFAAYLTSFFIIGIMWVNHHSMFRSIMRADRTLLFLNLLLLLWTTLLPFPTRLVAENLKHGGTNAAQAAAVYSANLTLAAIAFSLIWLHAVRGGRLLAEPLGGPREEWRSIGRFSVGTLLYAATIGISFVSAGAALAIQFALALYYLFEQVRSG
ncbi:MAG: potassium channel family protein [Pseudonocardiales bacterium]|nr:potassium channel family protein [Pseudonocardiales bacterium]